MERSFCTLAIVCFLVLGCGRERDATVGDADQPADDTPVQPTADPTPIIWDASLIDGGEMFEDYVDFRDYVRRSTLIAKGTLTRWDGKQGSVAVEQVLHGDPDTREAKLVYDGGFVTVQPGDKVLVLLRDEGGSTLLNSFCGVSGVTRWTNDISTIVQSALSSS
ncbi:MAG: hypothetical protein O3C40_12350 [Planctomycetota bacterium]|nr:hypothetical protein [Planctomycetota bacterium]